MITNLTRLEASLSLAEETLNKQNLPGFMTKRWKRALEKAKERLVEQPFFSWQNNRLLLVSLPNKKIGETDCKFYEATPTECRRIDKDVLCQAFFEGFPCWHRAAFLLLQIYFDTKSEMPFAKMENAPKYEGVNCS
ncbi:hypothetical protein BH24ACI1_BH24ACI1_24020 [soil metagenome]